MSRLFVVGDSTLSKFNDNTYYFPRYGYATQLDKFYNIEVINLALSGRSSKSFVLEKNYQILWDSIKSGDFLLIGFGHNDEKSDDHIRFTDASLPLEDEKSFAYSLYENYIKRALEMGVTPILSTPIVRLDLNNIYEGNAIHQTKNGDYRLEIINLAKKLNIDYADLTLETLKLMKSLDSIDQMYHHAMTAGKIENDMVVANLKSVDKAHLSYYGAYYVSYLFSLEIKKTNSRLNDYYISDAKIPTNADIIVNPNYKVIKYNVPNLLDYKPMDEFICKDGWYGTAFGDTDCNPNKKENGFIAKKVGNSFVVGQPNNYGKIHASVDAMSLVFRQIPITKNFRLKAKAKVLSFNLVKQSAFGLILRDDCYINQEESLRIANNYVASGFLTTDLSTYIIFSRSEPTDLDKGDNVINDFYQKDDEALLYIERLGQLISTKVIYKGVEYSRNYFDFDLVSVDRDYMYAGMFATKGVVVEYTGLEFEITGDAKEA